MNTTVTNKDGRISVSTGDLFTVWRAGSNEAAACQVATLHTQMIELQAENERLRDLKRTCECSEEDQCVFARERDEAIVRAKQAEQVINSINRLRDRAYEEIKQDRDDCAMLVKRLCHVVNATEPDNPVSRQALDYLDRKGLAGKPIR